MSVFKIPSLIGCFWKRAIRNSPEQNRPLKTADKFVSAVTPPARAVPVCEITHTLDNQEVAEAKQKLQCLSRVAGKTDARPVATDTTPVCLDALTAEK